MESNALVDDLKSTKSKLPFEETVSFIESKALENGWQVSKIYDIQNSLSKAGYKDFGRLKIIIDVST